MTTTTAVPTLADYRLVHQDEYAKLTADHAEVAALRTRAEAAEQTITELRQVIAGIPRVTIDYDLDDELDGYGYTYRAVRSRGTLTVEHGDHRIVASIRENRTVANSVSPLHCAGNVTARKQLDPVTTHYELTAALTQASPLSSVGRHIVTAVATALDERGITLHRKAAA